MHIDIFKITETWYYWLHIIQLHDAPFHVFNLSFKSTKILSSLDIKR